MPLLLECHQLPWENMHPTIVILSEVEGSRLLGHHIAERPEFVC